MPDGDGNDHDGRDRLQRWTEQTSLDYRHGALMTSQSAVVVAGGRSRRFDGRDKALLEVDGVPMLARVAHALAPVPGDLVINCRPDQRRDFDDALTAADLPCSYRLAIDRTPDRGPLAGLQRGLEVATGEIAVVVGCDVPLLEKRLVARLLECQATNDGDALVPTIDGRPQPLCAAYEVEPTIAAATSALDAGSRRLCDILETLSVTALDDPRPPKWSDPIRFQSVDTPADLRNVCRFLQRTGDEPASDPAR